MNHKSDHQVKFVSLALYHFDSGWELSVFHQHMDQPKIACPEDRYRYLELREAIELLEDVAVSIIAFQEEAGARLDLRFS